MSGIQGRIVDVTCRVMSEPQRMAEALLQTAMGTKKKRPPVAVEAQEVVEDGDYVGHAIATTDLDVPLSFTEDRHLCPTVGQVDCDVVKTQPCARLECWIDPLSLSPPKALKKIGQNLQAQYERWQPRARYKQSLDPTAEEVRKL